VNYIFDYLADNDNVKTFISVLAFILSVSNTAYLLITQRFNLKVLFKEYTIIDKIDDKPFILGLIIENKSRLPVSVSRMFLHINKEKFEFSWFPQIVFSSVLNQSEKTLSQSDTYSLCFPQNISSLGSCCGYFAIRSNNNFTIDDLKKSKCRIEIHSNRGKRSFKIDFSVLDCKLSK